MGDGYADFYDLTDDESVASDFEEEFSLDGDEDDELDSADPESSDTDEEDEPAEKGESKGRTEQKEEQKRRRELMEKRGEEETAKMPRTLFVGNLPLSATRKSLAKLFSVYGAVESVRLRGAVPEAGKGRGLKKKAIIKGKYHEMQRRIFGYVVFKSQNNCTTASREMNGYMLDGRHLRVDCAMSGGTNFKPRHCIFVGGLPYVADEEAVRLHFKPCGEILNVRVVRDACGAPKGIAFVEFSSEEGSVAALRRNGSEMEGRTIRVQRWSKKEKETQGKQKRKQSHDQKKGENTKPLKRKGKPIRIPTSIRKAERAEYVRSILKKRRRQKIAKRRNNEDSDGKNVKERKRIHKKEKTKKLLAVTEPTHVNEKKVMKRVKEVASDGPKDKVKKRHRDEVKGKDNFKEKGKKNFKQNKIDSKNPAVKIHRNEANIGKKKKSKVNEGKKRKIVK